MTRAGTLAAVLGAAVLGLAPAAGSRPTAAPSLRLQTRTPLVVAGRHFTPRERVRVLLSSSGGRWVRTMSASPSGAFVVTVTGMTLGHCASASVRATGSAGSRATLRIPPLGCSSE